MKLENYFLNELQIFIFIINRIMITREQLIEAFIKELSEETLEESLESFNEWLDYSVKIESIQSIINEL
jgi:hypothetical protein